MPPTLFSGEKVLTTRIFIVLEGEGLKQMAKDRDILSCNRLLVKRLFSLKLR